ncbi:LysR family transcriptional regulator [Variovorax sp. dw_954]|uniref:LysR family transcriptional regulator n=1 Tax=Variovorax sp. dw_954 TaxID=2720078 RepID=UPI001BD5FF78|nr:LysR family transcriptional regulator [Variovorax sp. dw_954]
MHEQSDSAGDILDLNDLRIFARVASLRNFSDAAATLGLHKATVSRNLARLERYLGAQLIDRSTRQIGLTPVGRELNNKCTELLSMVSAATSGAEGAGAVEKRETVTVNIDERLGAGLINRALPNFLLEQSAVDLVLVRCKASFIPASGDLTIVVGYPRPLSVPLIPAGILPRCICAAPSYLARGTAPRTLDEMGLHDLVTIDGDPGPASWMSGGRRFDVDPLADKPRVVCGDLDSARELVMAGVGIGCLPWTSVLADVQGGRLVQLLDHEVVDPIDLNVAFSAQGSPKLSAMALVESVKAMLAEACANLVGVNHVPALPASAEPVERGAAEKAPPVRTPET